MLMKLEKNVFIHSYSFGHISLIDKNALQIWKNPDVKLINATLLPNKEYDPELQMCAFLDLKYPDQAPHEIYASYARDWCVPKLKSFYDFLVEKHNIDCIIIIDGGSDSLMKGDESGLGDPIEDAVSVMAANLIEKQIPKILLAVGVGSDRFNDVSDASTLRAIAEITRLGGFLGSISLEPNNAGLAFYSSCLHYIYERQTFRSVLSGVIVASAWGHHAFDVPSDMVAQTPTPQDLPGMYRFPVGLKRIQPGQCYLWPLMAHIWAFDVTVVAKRSYICQWICKANSQSQCNNELYKGRQELKKIGELLNVEDFPTHEQMKY